MGRAPELNLHIVRFVPLAKYSQLPTWRCADEWTAVRSRSEQQLWM